MSKQHTMFALMILLVIVLFIKPEVFRNLYLSVLGRLLLVGAVIFFASNNLLFGLISVLVITIGSDMLIHNGMMEGLENINVTTTSGATNVTPDSTISELKQANDEAPANVSGGLDLETIKDAIKPKQSSSIPVSKDTFASDDVTPSTKEAFGSMYGRY
jgi:thiol:disulfide interchange protein